MGIVEILLPIFTELAERVDAGVLRTLKLYADAVVADGHGADEVSRLVAVMDG